MSEVVTLRPLSATYDYIDADAGIIQEIAERFTFFAPNHKFHPKFRTRVWDGKIRLLNTWKPNLYVGLRNELAKFCRANEYHLDLSYVDVSRKEFSVKEAEDFIQTLNLPKEMNGIPFTPRDEQIEAFVKCVRDERLTLLSPTSSGKSLIIYMMMRYWNKKTLIIVPTLGLVRQMKGDFEDYGYDVSNVHQIFSGQDKQTDAPVTVSTWQSLAGMPASFFQQFEVLICDEVHGAKAKELKDTIEKMVDCRIRIGTTGTLDGMKVNELVIQGLFGPIYRVITTKELMDQGKVAQLQIKSIILEHTEDNKKLMARATWPDEMNYLIKSEARNRFIKNLALSLKGNTLVLFQYVEKHGEPLHALIEAEADCPVLYVAGSVDIDERETVRKFVNEQTQSITVASKGCFSTGTNIPNIDHIIFASPSKARIQTLQSIGRGLRKSNRKNTCILFDIADDLSWKSWTNHTLNHYCERIKIYAQEEFVHRAYPIKLAA